MSAKQRKDGRWEARKQIMTLRGSVRVSGYGSDAQEAEADLEIKLIRRGLIQHSGSLNSYAERVYLPTVQHTGERWREQIAWALGHILPTLGPLPLSQLTRQRLQVYFNDLAAAKTLGRTSIGHVRKVLHAILSLAEADGIIPANPVRHVKLAPTRKAPKRTLTFAEAAALILHSHGYGSERIVYLGLMCGLRLGEVCRMRRTDVEDGILRVRGTKTDSAIREIPLPAELARILKTLPAAGNPHNTRRALENAAFRAQLGWTPGPHALRHSFATMLQRLGCPEDVRARFLGHRHRGVTSGYSHAEMETWRGWMELLWESVYREMGSQMGSKPA